MAVSAKFTINNNNPIRTVFRINAASASFYSLTGNPYDNANLKDALDAKQDVLTAGSGISIENNVISNTQTSAEWGNITGTLSDQTDLQAALNAINGNITRIDGTLNTYGNIVTYNASDFATAAQGALANTALQPNDNISELNNDANYITSSDLNGYATETWVGEQGYITGINQADVLDALGYTPYNASNPDGFISGITSSDVITALGYTPYNSTNPNGYQANVIESIKVNNATQTVVNKAVNITVPTTAAEVGALPDTTTINDLTTAAQQAALNSGANTTNIGQIATNTQAITAEVANRQNADNALQTQIDAIVASSDVFDIVGTYAELQAYDISTVPVNDIIKVLVDSTHNNAATYYRCVENNNVKSWSYIGAEGAYYTKGEADNLFVQQTITVNGQPLSSNVTLTASDVGALPSSTVIPTVNNATITINQGGVQKGTFTLNQSGDATINLDAGGGGGAVDSVNGYTGVVVLTASDVGALPDSTVIPTVNNPTITFTQGGVTKGTITLNQSSNQTIALDAGGGGGAVDSVNGQTGTVVLTASDVGALATTDVTEYTAAEVETLWGSI